MLGMTRMGLLHTIVRAHAGELPDHADGSVRDWVRVDVSEHDPFRFDVRVEDEIVAHATLEVERGVPKERHQLVRFGDDTMRVVERYAEITLNIATFETPDRSEYAPAAARRSHRSLPVRIATNHRMRRLGLAACHATSIDRQRWCTSLRVRPSSQAHVICPAAGSASTFPKPNFA